MWISFQHDIHWYSIFVVRTPNILSTYNISGNKYIPKLSNNTRIVKINFLLIYVYPLYMGIPSEEGKIMSSDTQMIIIRIQYGHLNLN